MSFFATTIAPALLIPVLFAAPPLRAQEPISADICAAARPAFPIGFEGWSTRTAFDAGSGTRTAPVIQVGRAAELRLVSFDRLAPATAPGRSADAGSNAGMALFQVARAGTYRIALGAPAWIDVVRAGRALPAAAHGHGPACTGIRKMVDYRLSPGRYILQLTGAQATTLPVMIAHWQKDAA